jgi:hypothetical protein
MTEIEFCRWLKGFLEIAQPDDINPAQVAIIKEHLDLVYNKVTTGYSVSNVMKVYAPYVQPNFDPDLNKPLC